MWRSEGRRQTLRLRSTYERRSGQAHDGRQRSNIGGLLSVVGGLMLFALIACSPSGTLQQMGEQPRYDPLAASGFFSDGMAARPVISDTYTFMQPMTDTVLYQGTEKGQLADAFPFPITDAVMARGQQRYNIYCSPCHGAVGDGQGIVAQRGLCCPASFQTDSLRNAPVGHYFDVISNGFGRMMPYAPQISVRDRWAIIAYIRALQLSQNATQKDVPPDQQGNLAGTATPAP